MLRSVFCNASGRGAQSGRPRSVRLRLLSLEDRTTPTALLVSPNFSTDAAHHRFATIQSAVDAAHSGDNIVVFPGTYKEAVSITTSNVDLLAVGPPSAVKIEAPAGADIAVHVDGGAQGVDIAGFTVSGGNAGIQFGDHFDSPASASGSGSATHDTVLGYTQVGIEVIGTGSSALLFRDVVHGPGAAGADNAPIGIQVSDGATANVKGNIVSDNLGNSTNEGVGILVFQTSGVQVTNNMVSGSDEGILLASFPGETRVTDTFVTNNVSINNTFNGIGLVNADNNQVVGNYTAFNGFDGINVGSDPNDPNALPGTAVGNTFDHNVAELNGRAGIFLESTATGNTLTHNRLRNNNTSHVANGADAVDLSTGTGTAGTANTWTKNIIGKSIPTGLQ